MLLGMLRPMSEQPSNSERGPSPKDPSSDASAKRGESLVWSAISTLVAGPAVWGGIGWAVDAWQHTEPIFTVIGCVVGFATSFYLVWLKFGRD